jgi:hypothetical protein
MLRVSCLNTALLTLSSWGKRDDHELPSMSMS